MSHESITRYAFISPFTNPTNPYNDCQKAIVASLGYVVLPFAIRTMFSRDLLRLFDRHNLIVLNWTESRAFRPRYGHAVLSVRGLAVLAFYLTVLSLARARVLYLIHNHFVHDSQGWQRLMSRRIIAVLCRLADIRGVLDPTAADTFRASYLPHPLLGHAPQPRADEIAVRSCRFLIIGQVRRYKGIERVLEVWPRGLRLEIVGRADPAYTAELAAIIQRRNLAECVTMESRFIPDDELHDRIAAADVLILPHQPDSALVSSAVFEALGRVPVILARSSPFNEWLAARFDAVQVFADDTGLATLASCISTTQEHPSLTKTYSRAQQLFGIDHCVSRYYEALVIPSEKRSNTNSAP